MLKPRLESPRSGGAEPHLPDPATAGPYRPFTTDPGWNEAWWWLGVPVLVAIWLLATWRVAPAWYSKWIIPEGYGILEFSQFVTVLIGLAIAVRLLFVPFVRKRPFVLAVTIIGAVSCLYIAGEEMSWGQHFFHWNTPEYWAAVNRQEETNLHNTYAVFEKWPRAILEFGVVIGGIVVPLAAAFFPRIRANRLSLFLPAGALMPAAIGAMAFKLADLANQSGVTGELLQKQLADLANQSGVTGELLQRPSEVIESYLYFFILAYLIVYTRRLTVLEAAERSRQEGSD